MRTVLIILFDGVQSLDVTGPLEAFAHATDGEGRPAYQIRTASLGGGAVRASSGLRLIPDTDLRDVHLRDVHLPARTAARGAAVPDPLIVPGGHGARHGDPELVAWLREHAGRARRLASVCTGAFLLAEAAASHDPLGALRDAR